MNSVYSIITKTIMKKNKTDNNKCIYLQHYRLEITISQILKNAERYATYKYRSHWQL